MRYTALMLAASLAIATTGSAALADTETTTTTTTTTYSLPVGGSYVAVDSNGVVLGMYDPATRLLNGQPLIAGSYVIEKTSGQVLATVDSSGNLIAFTSVPSTLPEHFAVVNGQLLYVSTGYPLRRAQLEQQINVDYAAGRLSNRDVKELREKLAEISMLENKRKRDGTYSSSTINSIEHKFACVQSDLAKDVAHINAKRAQIGIRVD